MRTEVLEILRCPDDHSTLVAASAELLEEVNAAIRADGLVRRGGKAVTQLLDGGLVRRAGDILYPIVDEIPLLLRDEAIELNQLTHRPAP